MTNVISNILVPLFFMLSSLGMAILAWWFITKKQKALKYFGIGILGYTIGFISWTILVITKPEDLKPLILIGVIPFLLAHIAYAKSASEKYKNYSSLIMISTILLLSATFISRTFFYPSEPYFSDNGLLFFGLQPVPIALYIATLSVSFLPAVRSVAEQIKSLPLRTTISICLNTLFINAVILVSAQDNTLLLINGAVLFIALSILCLKLITGPKKP